MQLTDYYALLGVSPSATVDEIQKAFEEKSDFWHPYENPSAADKEKMLKLLEAREILSDSQARMRYDEELQKYNNYLREKQAMGQSADDYEITDMKLVFMIRDAMARAQKELEKTVTPAPEPSNWSAKGCVTSFFKGFFLMIGLSLLYMLLLKACGQL